jgi:CRISPR-associated protein Cas5t
MRALKIEAEGPVTSFRYPHFMWQVHPTFDMPPPATIYGHICSAVGDWIDPASVRFAYRFTFESKGEDLEHIHVGDMVMPFHRELLFRPRLTLYLDRPDLMDAFLRPHYAVVLGRSQDLFTYTRVAEIELVQEDRAYYEHTLLPYSMAARSTQGVVVLMPRYVDYSQGRFPTFERYLVLHTRIVADPQSGHGLLYFGSEDQPLHWVDPEERDRDGVGRGVIWHTFVGGAETQNENEGGEG